MLEAVARKTKGIQTLESIEARDHYQTIETGREMGFAESSMPGDATLIPIADQSQSAVGP